MSTVDAVFVVSLAYFTNNFRLDYLPDTMVNKAMNNHNYAATVARLKDLTARDRIHILLKDLNLKTICEVGTWRGENFDVMMKSNPEIAVSVDAWLNDQRTANDYGATQEEFDQHYNNALQKQWKHDNVFVLRMLSVRAAKLFTPNFFDYVYIDADHSFEAVKADLEAWWPLVKPNGIMGGHDYKAGRRSKPCGVIPAVIAFVEKYGLQSSFHCTPEPASSWFVVKGNWLGNCV